ncbi:BACON domain-containing protein [Maribacter hydrothermalis]|uniref:BACON domain-containing protein n=1 Tax=Maribacter hydrothermalis TaxID=1836467 RepID=A0A1B7Z1J1_9FLAO|nr:hypothetical protein [Maribacter hydrothermalis]APQ18245.1 hypothetical protein BTR34_13325 [Maribacter hydrothermalis]OBR36591.1 hypothetical protein A9200_09215 [Maribacter hydrothermalis]
MKTNNFVVSHIFLLCFIIFIPLSCTTEESGSEDSLQISTNSIVLDENGRGTVEVSITGKGEYTINFVEIPEWLSFAYFNSDAIVSEGNNLELEVIATSNLVPGIYTGTAIITAEGVGSVSLIVTYEVLASNMNLSKNILDFGYFENELEFEITNTNGPTFNWEIQNSNSFITYEPSTGILNQGASITVRAILNREVLTSDISDFKIPISSNLDQVIDQNVNINYFKEEKFLIDGVVVDAEYDRENDVLIFVSTSPNKLNKYNPITKQVSSLDLNMSPNCVSIAQDGNHAAVGHNGRFSYVNLQTMQLEQMFEVTCDASDIILAPNNWVYVFQKDYQGTEFRCFSLGNGMETLSTGWGYYNSKAKLHPSGNYLYVANNGLTPSDFDKYDITGGAAIHLYDSPYHGDFDFAGNIWINESGNRLFAKSRNVFDATDDQLTDMKYDGVLDGVQMIATMDVHTAKNKLYAILETGDGWPKIPGNIINVYDAEFLTYQSQITLPGFLKNNEDEHPGVYDSEGHYSFFNGDGTEYYVLVKTKSNYNPYDGSNYYFPNDWAIVTLPVN